AFQRRRHAGALSCLQARLAAQQPGRAAVVDQPPPRRQPDRLRRRVHGGPQDVRRRTRQAWRDLEDGAGLRGRASQPPAEGRGVTMRRRRPKRGVAHAVLRLAAIAIVLALLPAAASAQDIFTYAGADRSPRILDGARKEGTVTLYSSANVVDMNPQIA